VGAVPVWEVDEEAGSAAWRADQLHGSGEGVDAVVSHSQGEELPALFYRDVHGGGVRVLRRIRQGLTDDLIGAGLDRIGQPAVYLRTQPDRHGRAAGQGFRRGPETASGKD
jgi:hypothetical protein